jgi:hypothetical protein
MQAGIEAKAALIDKGQRANLSKADVNELAKELSVLAENYRRGR